MSFQKRRKPLPAVDCDDSGREAALAGSGARRKYRLAMRFKSGSAKSEKVDCLEER